MIEIENLSFSYPDTPPILENLNLSVSKGETITIMGPNGSGKTTLGSCLCGLIPHVIKGEMEGNVTINGINTRKSKIEDIINGIGYFFQNPDSQFVTLRVKDELTFGLENQNIDEFEVERRVDEVSNLFGLSRIMDRAPQELSMGQKQKVILASLVAMKPKILVLDEPSSNFDPKMQKEFVGIIKKFQEEGFTIIIFSHNLNQVKEISERVLVLRDKNFKFDGSPDFLTSESLSKIYEIEGENLRKPSLPEDALPLIHFEKVSFRYSRAEDEAVKNVSFTVRKGEILGIAGPNGSGKSTILLLMANLLKPSKGMVKLNGVEVERMEFHELAKQIGIVFQNPNHQIFAPTVLDELRFGLTNLDFRENEINRRIDTVSGLVDLGNLSRDPHSLSYGQTKLLSIATVLLMDPQIVLLDEPELSLDIGYKTKIENLLLKLNKEGKTIVVVSHDLDLLEKLSHRIIFIDGGELKYEGVSEYMSNELRRLFNV